MGFGEGREVARAEFEDDLFFGGVGFAHVGCVAEAEGLIEGWGSEGFGEFCGRRAWLVERLVVYCGVQREGKGKGVLLSKGISHAAIRAYSLISRCCSNSP